MKRSIILSVTLAMCLAPAAMAINNKASGDSVVGSSHDLRVTGGGTALVTDQDNVCVSCHTPHQPTGQSTDPLWNHDLSATPTYGVYSSNTLDVTPTEIGGGTAVSNLCMSCHDGTISVAAMYNPPNYDDGGTAIAVTASGDAFIPNNIATLTGFNATGVMASTNLANMGTDLTNDHPVNFDYTTSDGADAGLQAEASLPSWALDGSGFVQCSSCHDPHDETYKPFLSISNTNSALCTTCHLK